MKYVVVASIPDWFINNAGMRVPTNIFHDHLTRPHAVFDINSTETHEY